MFYVKSFTIPNVNLWIEINISIRKVEICMSTVKVPSWIYTVNILRLLYFIPTRRIPNDECVFLAFYYSYFKEMRYWNGKVKSKTVMTLITLMKLLETDNSQNIRVFLKRVNVHFKHKQILLLTNLTLL